jgi:hypothetical protein
VKDEAQDGSMYELWRGNTQRLAIYNRRKQARTQACIPQSNPNSSLQCQLRGEQVPNTVQYICTHENVSVIEGSSASDDSYRHQLKSKVRSEVPKIIAMMINAAEFSPNTLTSVDNMQCVQVVVSIHDKRDVPKRRGALQLSIPLPPLTELQRIQGISLFILEGRANQCTRFCKIQSKLDTT